MNSRQRKRILKIVAAIFALITTACGVKGDPLPPERPVDLGRGRPTFKRVTEGLKVERARPVPREQDEDDDERDDSDGDEQDQ